LLLLAVEPSCATGRPFHEIAGGGMVLAGSLVILTGLGAATPCDPASGSDCRHGGVVSEDYAPFVLGGGLVLVLAGVVVYFAATGHGSSPLPPTASAPSPPAPPPPPPSPPIEPLPMDQRR
jgi:hypothetical protein